MFLIAPCRRVWQAGTLPNAKQRRKRKSRNGHFAETFSQKEERHEYDTWIKNSLVHLHRQMDAQDFVFATKQALSPRAVAPPLGRVSQRMLTRTLRNLESVGLIDRRVTQSRAITVEYSLTNLGRTIIAPLRGMCRWAKRHRKKVTADVTLSNT